MNKEWSEQNKKLQMLIQKADTFDQGKEVLFELLNDLNREDFDSMPFMNADGYHCKADLSRCRFPDTGSCI